MRLRPPLPPMEAATVDDLPTGGWSYEPKWDGFRCLLFRDGDEVELQSKAGQPLTRYFPELVVAARRVQAARFVLDGELVVPSGKGLSFEALLQRIHPAASRVARLARETPALLVVFDLLAAEDGASLLARPFDERRRRLERFVRERLATHPAFRLSPASSRVARARAWLAGRDGLDGVIAKRRDAPYAAGERTAMVKVKRWRSADCVVGGFRYASSGEQVGSLLLGLHDEQGLLHHVGFTSGLTAVQRRELAPRLRRLVQPPGFTGRAPGGPSRWSRREAPWHPLAPRLVVEVGYDHFSDGRFRHGTRLMRWRPDKRPDQCTFQQIGLPAAALRVLLRPGTQRRRTPAAPAKARARHLAR